MLGEVGLLQTPAIHVGYRPVPTPETALSLNLISSPSSNLPTDTNLFCMSGLPFT